MVDHNTIFDTQYLLGIATHTSGAYVITEPLDWSFNGEKVNNS